MYFYVQVILINLGIFLPHNDSFSKVKKCVAKNYDDYGVNIDKTWMNTPFSNLFAVTTCHMKTRPYLVNCEQTDIRM